MSSLPSIDAIDYPPQVRRIVYVLTDSRGWFITDVCEVGWASYPDPMKAVNAGCAWLSYEAAMQRQQAAMSVHNELTVTIAQVELVLNSGGWQAVSTSGFSQP